MKKSELWARVAIAVAGSANYLERGVAARWADQITKDFEERFPEEKHSEEIKIDLVKSTPEEVNISLKFAEFLKSSNVEEKLK